MLLSNYALPIAITRTAASSYVAGALVPGATTTINITGIVQPVKGFELLNFPEGQRTLQIVRIYTDTALQTANEATGAMADQLTINGAAYQVTRVEDQTATPLPHWRSFAIKIEPTAEHST